MGKEQGGSTGGEHGDSAVAHEELRGETRRSHQHLRVRVPKKRVNAEANEAKRSRGNCFVARHLDEGTPVPGT